MANLYANARNHGFDALGFLDALPLERIGYVHVGGGTEHDGLYHDTHAHPVPPAVLDLLSVLCERRRPPGILLERDAAFPADDVLRAELASLAEAADRGAHAATPTKSTAPANPATPAEPPAVP